jgi:hypothetical protein
MCLERLPHISKPQKNTTNTLLKLITVDRRWCRDKGDEPLVTKENKEMWMGCAVYVILSDEDEGLLRRQGRASGSTI